MYDTENSGARFGDLRGEVMNVNELEIFLFWKVKSCYKFHDY